MHPRTMLMTALVMALIAPGTAHAQFTRIGGDVTQTTDIDTVIVVAASPGTTAIVRSAAIIEGASIDGSVRQSATGGIRAALALGPQSTATITEATVCGDVYGDARLTSHVGAAYAVALTPGGSSNLRMATVGRGSFGSVRKFVSIGTLAALDFVPFVRSTISLASVGRGC